MTLMVNQLAGFGGGSASSGLTLTFIGSHESTITSDTYTFTSVDIGTPSADRLVIVVAFLADTSGQSGGVISFLSIGGTNATINVEAPGGSGNETDVVIASRLVTSGTTATIVVDTGSDAQIGVAIAVFTLTNYASATPSTGGTAISGGTEISLSTTVNEQQIGIIASGAYLSGRSCGWSNATEVLELAISDGSGTLSVAVLETGSGTQTRTATWNTSSDKAIAAAVWAGV